MRIFFRIFLILILISVAIPAWYLADLPDTSVWLKQNPKTSAIREHRESQIREKGRKPRSSMQWRNLNQISPLLQQAVVMAKDGRFYQHNGFDVEQLKKAVHTNWERKKFAFGASTITQQLARTLYLSSEKRLLRKAKEALITRRLEETLTKKRILELYLNVVEWGPQIYGAEAASQHFFGKPASDLTPDEAISLAVILPSPRKWNPLSEKGFIARRRNQLYDLMVMAGFISPPAELEPETEPAIDGEPPEIEPAPDAEHADDEFDVEEPDAPEQLPEVQYEG
jgi:monofunctional biosynthetic peptidoglycan transglycosylase